jgi:hypothetical protein
MLILWFTTTLIGQESLFDRGWKTLAFGLYTYLWMTGADLF